MWKRHSFSRLSQNTSQPSQHIANANPVCARTFLDFSIAVLEALCGCAENAVCDALSRVAVLLDLVHAVCEEVDVGFEGLAEFQQVRM